MLLQRRAGASERAAGHAARSVFVLTAVAVSAGNMMQVGGLSVEHQEAQPAKVNAGIGVTFQVVEFTARADLLAIVASAVHRSVHMSALRRRQPSESPLTRRSLCLCRVLPFTRKMSECLRLASLVMNHTEAPHHRAELIEPEVGKVGSTVGLTF